MAARADDAAAVHLGNAPARPGGRSPGRRRARRGDDRAGACRGGAADPPAAARAARRGGCADRGPGLDPPPLPRDAAGHRRARPDGRQASRLRPRRATGSAPPSRSIATSPSPSWPAATWSATRRPTTATWPAGPACRCATPAPAWRRSPRSWSSASDGLVHLAAHPPLAEVPAPRLLGAFDPVLLGWTSREPILGPHTHLVTMNGIFRPFAMVKGRAVATWKLNRGKVTIEPLGRIAKTGQRGSRRRRRRCGTVHGGYLNSGQPNQRRRHGTASGPLRGDRPRTARSCRATTPSSSTGASKRTTR